jgi:hypothetical protein
MNISNKFSLYLSRICSSLSLIVIGILVSGTKACQEDYNLAPGASGGTATPTPAETVTRTPQGTPSTAPTRTPVAEEEDPEDPDDDEDLTPTVTATITATATGTSMGLAALNLAALNPDNGDSKDSKISDSEPEAEFFKDLANLSSQDAAGSVAKSQNWLGNAFRDSAEEDRSDYDRDGFSAQIERLFGGDDRDSAAYPKELRTRLSSQKKHLILDSDQDGCDDGLETKLGTDPFNSEDHLVDTDGDCLNRDQELSQKSDITRIDTDQDGLDDAAEYLLGLNPQNPDSDGDGVLDGREVALSSDPRISELE